MNRLSISKDFQPNEKSSTFHSNTLCHRKFRQVELICKVALFWRFWPRFLQIIAWSGGLVGGRSSEEGSAVRDNRQTTKVKQVVLPKRSAVLAILYQAFAQVKQVVLLCLVH